MQTRYLEIDDLTYDLKDYLDEADPELVTQFKTLFDYSWVHHENALEGVVLTYPEIHGALTQRVITDLANMTLFKKIRAYFDVIEKARSCVDQKRFKFSVELFQDFYETISLKLDRDKGKFRRDIPLHRTYFHDILPPERILPELEDLVEWANGPDLKALHPITQAAEFGHRFMQVFPWSEVSGNVGRMGSNILLMRAGYFPVVIHAHDRERYYSAVKQPPVALRELIVESMENSLTNSLKFFRAQGVNRQGRTG